MKKSLLVSAIMIAALQTMSFTSICLAGGGAPALPSPGQGSGGGGSGGSGGGGSGGSGGGGSGGSGALCSNGKQGSTAGKAKSPNKAGDPFTPSTGNDEREVTDLELFAGAGDHKLQWGRNANSRYSSGVSYFGSGGNFRHSYQWELITASTNSMTLYYPDGAIWTFTQSTTNPNQYLSTAACTDRLFLIGNSFVLQTQNGYQYYFLPVGSSYQMAYFLDAHGAQYNLSYDVLGRVTQVTEPAGRSLTVTYTGNVISTVQASDGRTVSYYYNNFTDPLTGTVYPTLTSVNYPDGTQASYSYTQPIPKTRPVVSMAIDPRYPLPFAQLGLTYHTNNSSIIGQIATQYDIASGTTLNILGTVASNNTTCPMVTEPAAQNAQSSYWITEATGLVQWNSDGLGNRTYYTYDQNGYGFMNSIKDANGHTAFMGNSPYGNLLSCTNADGSVENWTRDAQDRVLTYQDPRGNTTTYTRNSNGLVTMISHPDSTTESFTYNNFNEILIHTLRNGCTISNTYDGRGLLSSTTDPLGNTTSYTYDSADRLSGYSDALGHITQLSYNDLYQITQIVHPDGTSVNYSYDTFGNLTNTVDENGASWSKTYDSYRQLTSSTDPLGNTTTFGYYAIYHDLTNLVTLPSGKQTVVGYDAAFHATNKISGYGTADAAAISYGYDAAGNLTKTVDGNGQSWSYSYDSRNRKISESNPLGNKTQYSYDPNGNVLTMTTPAGQVTTNAYDAMNRLVSTTDPLGQMTSFSYDASGNLLSMTDPKGNRYSYTYDQINRRLSLTYPDGTQELWSYDAVGNLSTYTTRAGQVCGYTYDSRNRNTGYTWSDGTLGNSKTYDAVGRLLSKSNGNSTLTYTYDLAGRELSETQAITGQSPHTVSYVYDGDGNVTSTIYPNGSVISKGFTGRDQVASIAADGPPPLATYSYDPAGNRIGNAMENGVGVTYSYDKASRLVGLTNALAGATNPIAGYQYSLNGNGLRYGSRETTPLFSRGNNYGYDADNQVTNTYYGGGGIGTRTFSYDAAGNRNATSSGTTNTVIPYVANACNQYTQVGSLLLTSDQNGNLTRDQKGNTYGYDAQNRLISAKSGTNTLIVAYDSQNRVVSRTINGLTTTYAYDGWNLIEEYNASGAEQVRYVYGNGDDEPLCIITPNGTYYYQQDGNGNVTAITDTNGNILEHYAYDPFGNVTITGPTGTVLLTSFIGNRFMFSGREFISQIGLYDYRNRFYSAGLGRFLQTDPILFEAGDVSIYRYCGNDSINWGDPYGLRITYHGFTQHELNQVHQIEKNIQSTKRGKQLWDSMKNNKKRDFKITKDCKGSPNYDPNTDEIHFDPNFTTNIQTDGGPVPASPERILGHEAGHAVTGTLDDGLNNMNNVNQNENPIATRLGQPARTQY